MGFEALPSKHFFNNTSMERKHHPQSQKGPKRSKIETICGGKEVEMSLHCNSVRFGILPEPSVLQEAFDKHFLCQGEAWGGMRAKLVL